MGMDRRLTESAGGPFATGGDVETYISAITFVCKRLTQVATSG